jgi:hypothetical protein
MSPMRRYSHNRIDLIQPRRLSYDVAEPAGEQSAPFLTTSVFVRSQDVPEGVTVESDSNQARNAKPPMPTLPALVSLNFVGSRNGATAGTGRHVPLALGEASASFAQLVMSPNRVVVAEQALARKEELTACGSESGDCP